VASSDDLYAALMGEPVNTREKQAAIADLLRRRAGFAGVAQLTGDPALAPMGEQQAQQTQQQAQMLQQRPGPEMRGNGRVQTAANPLEFVGAGLQQYAGIRKERQAAEQLDALRKQQIQGRQLYANKLLDTPYRRQSMTAPLNPDQDFGVKAPNFSF